MRILAIDIFLRERKGARWNIKRSAALQQTVTTPASVALLCHPRSTSPPPIYGAFCTFDIFYCRSPLFVLFMFLLGATLSSGHPTSALAWPAAILKVPRAKFTPSFLHGRPVDITKDLLVMQTRCYIKTIYFGNAVPQWVRGRVGY